MRFLAGEIQIVSIGEENSWISPDRMRFPIILHSCNPVLHSYEMRFLQTKGDIRLYRWAKKTPGSCPRIKRQELWEMRAPNISDFLVRPGLFSGQTRVVFWSDQAWIRFSGIFWSDQNCVFWSDQGCFLVRPGLARKSVFLQENKGLSLQGFRV